MDGLRNLINIIHQFASELTSETTTFLNNFSQTQPHTLNQLLTIIENMIIKEQLATLETKIMGQAIRDSPTLTPPIINLMINFLQARYLWIQRSDLSYNISPRSTCNRYFLKLATFLFSYSAFENYQEILMPIDNSNKQLCDELNQLALTEFILDEQIEKPRIIAVHSCLSSARESGQLLHTQLIDQKVKPLSDEDAERIVYHSKYTEKVYRSIKQYLYFQTSDQTSVYSYVKRLIDGLWKSGVHGGFDGTEETASTAADNVIKEFSTFLKYLTEEERNKLFNYSILDNDSEFDDEEIPEDEITQVALTATTTNVNDIPQTHPIQLSDETIQPSAEMDQNESAETAQHVENTIPETDQPNTIARRTTFQQKWENISYTINSRGILDECVEVTADTLLRIITPHEEELKTWRPSFNGEKQDNTVNLHDQLTKKIDERLAALEEAAKKPDYVITTNFGDEGLDNCVTNLALDQKHINIYQKQINLSFLLEFLSLLTNDEKVIFWEKCSLSEEELIQLLESKLSNFIKLIETATTEKILDNIICKVVPKLPLLITTPENFLACLEAELLNNKSSSSLKYLDIWHLKKLCPSSSDFINLSKKLPASQFMFLMSKLGIDYLNELIPNFKELEFILTQINHYKKKSDLITYFEKKLNGFNLKISEILIILRLIGSKISKLAHNVLATIVKKIIPSMQVFDKTVANLWDSDQLLFIEHFASIFSYRPDYIKWMSTKLTMYGGSDQLVIANCIFSHIQKYRQTAAKRIIQLFSRLDSNQTTPLIMSHQPKLFEFIFSKKNKLSAALVMVQMNDQNKRQQFLLALIKYKNDNHLLQANDICQALLLLEKERRPPVIELLITRGWIGTAIYTKARLITLLDSIIHFPETRERILTATNLAKLFSTFATSDDFIALLTGLRYTESFYCVNYLIQQTPNLLPILLPNFSTLFRMTALLSEEKEQDIIIQLAKLELNHLRAHLTNRQRLLKEFFELSSKDQACYLQIIGTVIINNFFNEWTDLSELFPHGRANSRSTQQENNRIFKLFFPYLNKRSAMDDKFLSFFAKIKPFVDLATLLELHCFDNITTMREFIQIAANCNADEICFFIKKMPLKQFNQLFMHFNQLDEFLSQFIDLTVKEQLLTLIVAKSDSRHLGVIFDHPIFLLTLLRKHFSYCLPVYTLNHPGQIIDPHVIYVQPTISSTSGKRKADEPNLIYYYQDSSGKLCSGFFVCHSVDAIVKHINMTNRNSVSLFMSDEGIQNLKLATGYHQHFGESYNTDRIIRAFLEKLNTQLEKWVATSLMKTLLLLRNEQVVERFLDQDLPTASIAKIMKPMSYISPKIAITKLGRLSRIAERANLEDRQLATFFHLLPLGDIIPNQLQKKTAAPRILLSDFVMRYYRYSKYFKYLIIAMLDQAFKQESRINAKPRLFSANKSIKSQLIKFKHFVEAADDLQSPSLTKDLMQCDLTIPTLNTIYQYVCSIIRTEEQIQKFQDSRKSTLLFNEPCVTLTIQVISSHNIPLGYFNQYANHFSLSHLPTDGKPTQYYFPFYRALFDTKLEVYSSDEKVLDPHLLIFLIDPSYPDDLSKLEICYQLAMEKYPGKPSVLLGIIPATDVIPALNHQEISSWAEERNMIYLMDIHHQLREVERSDYYGSNKDIWSILKLALDYNPQLSTQMLLSQHSMQEPVTHPQVSSLRPRIG